MSHVLRCLGVIGLIGFTGYLYFLKQVKQFTGNLGPRETSPVKGTPGGKIVLTGFFTPVGRLVGSVSPFTNKVETYLRFAGLQHETRDGPFAGSPKGRVRSSPHVSQAEVLRTSNVSAVGLD